LWSLSPHSMQLRQHKRGRPSNYNSEVAWAICDRLVEGESLRRICSDAGMPGKATVFRWIARHKEFRDRYISARDFQAEAMVTASRVAMCSTFVLLSFGECIGGSGRHLPLSIGRSGRI
jgi:hypothetical protein